MVEISAAALGTRLKALFAPRDVLFHNGTTLRRIRFGGKRQAAIAAIGAVTLGFSGYGAAQAAHDAAAATGVVVPPTADIKLAQMQHQIGQMRQRVATIRETAEAHAKRIEQRQALITAALTGSGDAKALSLATPSIDPAADKLAAEIVKPLVKLEGRQVKLASVAQDLLDQRYAETTATVRKLGLRPERIAKRSRGARSATAMGGPMIAANSEEASADLRADAQFRTLFQTWKKLDTLQQGAIAIPSVQPVHALSFTSNFGIRSDPFRGTAAMHAGVDIPGPIGTPIYATADGIIAHAGRQGGYGNMVEINHGKGIATRYGHLSKILVADNARVTRGQLIALMGSTGRSTGSHLHYEVRIDGHAVNPVPFLTTADYLLAAQDRSVNAIPVSTTGPAAQD
ncbi:MULTISPECIES: M23 family metallopeptidase [unclassified Sphingomonas]|uniref:M23 family metallopeptidase n=1 Tax=unclassified Sphingomonas TaxID=196159 RepID=UPI00071639A0|nr:MULTISPECIES: M23 family metallopeptidase [unclassified Sphingomonas]KQO05159.1 peptidase M23 [Sphingomonas sp. Leaf242]TCP72347.1 murein DD-endopeptidase MepM/ murein hydrolase activator NlpD [Sphingomonas sp. PP-CE-1G-424]